MTLRAAGVALLLTAAETVAAPHGAVGAAGMQGPQGMQGPAGPAVHTFAVCVDPSPSTSTTCSCSGGHLVSRTDSPCHVTSDTGTCSAFEYSASTTSGTPRRTGQCCVC